MPSRFCLITLLLFGIFLRTMSLKCRVCGTYDCKPTPENCPVGIVKDVCNCCDVCGKNENEVCGGPWNIIGKCGEGLKCVEEDDHFESKGICQKE
uniref:Venom toxin n=1 Tax=Hemiscorpius lepturus TaxID=520031 RepID=A0A1L4BJ65_HEMLE|nr:venom toxin [Hemiscorpius lepturus]